MAARLLVFGIVLSVLLTAGGCATPVMPTGGPPDRTPPELVSSEPAAEAVNVRADRLLLEFSKPVDEASVRQALAITPDFERRPEVIVRGRRVEVRFPEELREQTTYLVTLGTDLRDLRNNRLPEPITVAFATGPQLDEGRIEGWVRDPETGRGIGDVAIFAYALASEGAPLPDPRSEAPAYLTETGTDGRFRFEYLREAPYFVVAVEDRNRNRRADPGEAFGVPLDRFVVAVPAGDEAPMLPLYLTRVDTLAPEPLRVRPRSERRIAVRFTEAIVLADADPDAFAITDSLSGQPVPIRAVYPDEDVFQFVIETAPMSRAPHGLTFVRPEAGRDSAGNALLPSPLAFTPSSEPDTEEARIVAFEPVGQDTLRTLRPGENASVRFSLPPVEPPARERMSVVAPDGSPIEAEIASADGVRYVVEPARAGPFELRVRQPDSLHVMRYRPLPADSLGDLSGQVANLPGEIPVIVEIVAEDGYSRRAMVAADGTFRVQDLPAGTYSVRIFFDGDGSGEWSGGLLAPYRPPDLLKIIPGVRVRARWEQEMEPITLDPAATAAPVPPSEPLEPELPGP